MSSSDGLVSQKQIYDVSADGARRAWMSFGKLRWLARRIYEGQF
jgi:hypothetical protein